MKFIWKGHKAVATKTLTVKVGGNQSIVFTKDVPYQFQNDAHYRPYKPRMEALIRDPSSGFVLVAREYPPRVYSSTIEENKRKAAPVRQPPGETAAETAAVLQAEGSVPPPAVQDFREEAREKVKMKKKEEAATAKRLARNAAQAKGKREPMTTQNQVPVGQADAAEMKAALDDGDYLSKSEVELRAILKARGKETSPEATKAELLDLL